MSATINASPPTNTSENTGVGLSINTTGGLRVQPQDGAGNDVSSSHPMPVALGAGALVLGSVTINRTTPGTTNTVAPITGQDGVAGNTGVLGATTQRVTIATDDPLLSSANPVQTYVSNSYLNVAAGTATTAVKASAGTLAAIQINTVGAASNTLTVYDSLAGSGTKIATINTTVSAGLWTYGVAFGTGLTIVSATGTGADYTVMYR